MCSSSKRRRSRFTNNSKLRDVIAKAKSNNMPNDYYRKRYQKSCRRCQLVNYVQNTYEGYGPNGIAIIVETLTDNKNRTAANVRSAFSKGRGNIVHPAVYLSCSRKKDRSLYLKKNTKQIQMNL